MKCFYLNRTTVALQGSLFLLLIYNSFIALPFIICIWFWQVLYCMNFTSIFYFSTKICPFDMVSVEKGVSFWSKIKGNKLFFFLSFTLSPNIVATVTHSLKTFSKILLQLFSIIRIWSCINARIGSFVMLDFFIDIWLIYVYFQF